MSLFVRVIEFGNTSLMLVEEIDDDPLRQSC